ncbi:MAG: methyltransferase domain-containing protein, partial [Promethearchaeota archaeon]
LAEQFNWDLPDNIFFPTGGGEGVIGQFKREQVVAIDPNRKELEEAPSIGDLKIVMDAKDLKFLDNTFDTATSFFTFMYVPKTDHNKIFQEIYRVLKKNGEFAIWDIILPRREDNKKELFVIRLKIKIGDKTIDTGYGTMWNKEQDMHYFSNLGKDIGFKILESREDDNNFYLRFRKE